MRRTKPLRLISSRPGGRAASRGLTPSGSVAGAVLGAVLAACGGLAGQGAPAPDVAAVALPRDLAAEAGDPARAADAGDAAARHAAAAGAASSDAAPSVDELTTLSGRRLAPPLIRRPSIVAFPAFGPTPGSSPDDFRAWSLLLVERFYAAPAEERQAEIEAALAPVHVTDLTPIYLDLVVGLDMAEPSDAALGRAISYEWYLRQLRYTSVVMNRATDDVGASAVANRLLVLDGWRRWWEATLAEPERVERFRQRVDDLAWELRRVDLDPAREALPRPAGGP